MATEYLYIGAVIIGLLILWKSRKIIWFFLLFFGALAVYLGIHYGMEEFNAKYPEYGLALLIGGAVLYALRFAWKKS